MAMVGIDDSSRLACSRLALYYSRKCRTWQCRTGNIGKRIWL